MTFSCFVKREKIGQNLFFTRKIACFFQNFLFSTTSKVKQNALISTRQNVKRVCGPSKSVPWRFSHWITRRKKGQKLLSRWKKLFFEMFVFIDLLVPKEMFFSCAKSLSEALVDPFKLFPDICHVRYCEGKWAKVISSLEPLPFFLKTLCFQQLVRSWKIAVTCSCVKFKRICGPLYFVPSCFSYSIIQAKIGQKLLSSRRKLFFEMFVSVDQLGPNKCSYQSNNQRQNTLWTLINCSLSLFKFDKTRKKRPTSFLHWKGCLVFDTFVFSTTS